MEYSQSLSRQKRQKSMPPLPSRTQSKHILSPTPLPSSQQSSETASPEQSPHGNWSFANISVARPASTENTQPAREPAQLKAQGETALMSNSEPVQRQENNTGLPDQLKAEVENLSGISMNQVRVHYHSSKPAQIQALAYTQGTNIHMGPGQERHLPHEAWHVVQQMQGRVKPTMQTKGVAINDSQALESEADTMGARVAKSSATPAQKKPMPQMPSEPVQQKKSVAQRLVSPAAFKDQSKKQFSLRSVSSINAIDKGLQSYEGQYMDIDKKIISYDKVKNTDFAQRTQLLRAVEAAGLNFINSSKNNDPRRTAVQELLDQAKVEHTYLDAFLEAANTTKMGDKIRALMKAQNAMISAMRTGHNDATLTKLSVAAQEEIVKIEASITSSSPDEISNLVQSDKDALLMLKDEPGLPAITKQIIEEVFANEPDINLVSGMPGATFSKPGQAKPYTVKHALVQGGGTPERLGSLVHEMTHISVSKTFNNTPIFLAFPGNTGKATIQTLIQQRESSINGLKQLLDNDQTLAPDQIALVSSKIEYSQKNGFPRYLANFKSAGKIDAPTTAYLQTLTDTVNNMVIEYETVLNQILVYMALWKIPQNNPFYAQLRIVAQQAYDYRSNQRNATNQASAATQAGPSNTQTNAPASAQPNRTEADPDLMRDFGHLASHF